MRIHSENYLSSEYFDDKLQSADFKCERESMKKRALVLVIGVLAIASFLFFACNDGGGGGYSRAKAFGPDSAAYILDSNSGRSLNVRSLADGSSYYLTIITPIEQSTGGAVNAFDTKEITITVSARENLANGRVRFSVSRSDGGSAFFITLNNDGSMYRIENLSETQGGVLNQLGNSEGLNGFWVCYFPIQIQSGPNQGTYLRPMSFSIFGDTLITSMWNLANDLTPVFDQFRYNITVNGNFINFAESQEKFNTVTNEWYVYTHDPTQNKTKQIQYELSSNGNNLNITFTDEYQQGNNPMIGFGMPVSRAPTN